MTAVVLCNELSMAAVPSQILAGALVSSQVDPCPKGVACIYIYMNIYIYICMACRDLMLEILILVLVDT